MSSAVPSTGSDGYRLFRLRAIASLVGLVILVTGVMMWKIHATYRSEERAATAQTQTFVQAIDAHVTNSIQLADFSLRSLANAIRVLNIDGKNAEARIQALLSQPGAATLDPNFSILFIDAQGKGVAASNGLKVQGRDYSRNDYFLAHSSGRHGEGVYIGGPVAGDTAPQRGFFLSRRVENAKGKFLGVIAAPMNAAQFAAVFENARYAEGISIGLLHRSGTVIARVPDFEGTFARDMSKSALFERLAVAPAGTYRAVSPIDQQPRIFSYRSLADYPLTVLVGINEESLKRVLHRDILIGSIGFVLLSGIVLALGMFGLRSYGKLERSEANYRQLYRSVQAAERALSKNETRLRTITDNLPVLISYLDRDHRFRFANRTFQLWFGRPAAEILDQTDQSVFGPEMYQIRKDWIARALQGERVEFESETQQHDGVRHLHTTYIPDIAEDGMVLGLYALGIDVTASKESERQLKRLTRYDTLTGLPNRSFFNEKLAEAAARSRRHGRPFAVMFLDVDHFKSINDRHGHSVGDAVLVEFARRLQSGLRSTDTPGRWAGDEFVAIVEEQRSPAETEYIAIKLLESIQKPFEVNEVSVPVTTSIGILFVYAADISPSDIIDRADKALYKAKQAGRNTYHLDV